MADRVVYIVNPASQNGTTGTRWPSLVPHLPKGEAWRTEGPLHAIELAQKAAKEGVSTVVSVGGDGTLNEVVSGLMTVEDAHRPAVGVVPQGTGGDFRRTLGYPQRITSIGAILARGHTRLIDVGHLRYEDREGTAKERHFINICSFGISGVVDDEVNRTSKALGGTLSFLIGTLRGLMRFDEAAVEIALDDGPFEAHRVVLTAVCNGRYFGGGMMTAPTADPSDGRFEVVTIRKEAGLARYVTLARVYSGGHLGEPFVSYQSARRVRAKSASDSAKKIDVLLDVDGEQLGRLPLDVEIVPKALRFVC